MIAETNMDGIRDVAKTFLMLPPKPTDLAPLVVKHPFTDSAFAVVDGKEGEHHAGTI